MRQEEARPGHRPGDEVGHYPLTMRAVQIAALGGPEVLRPARLPLPDPGAGEVLIRNAYVGVNFADVKSRRGGHHIARSLPFLPGLDVAGTIASLGDGVEGLHVGQRVAAATDGGAYAEYARARAVLTWALPDPDVDLREVAGIVAMMTAYNVLIKKAALQTGESVLVHAAAGGVGTLLLQLAKIHGAGRVVAVVGSDAKVAVAERYGADEVIVSRGEGYGGQLDAVLPDGADVVMDAVGGGMFAAAFERLAPYGRIVNFGNAAGDPAPIDPAAMHKKNLTLVGYSSGTYRKSRPEGVRLAGTRMLELHAEGALRVPVGHVYRLEEAAEAHRAIESRSSTGKLILEI